MHRNSFNKTNMTNIFLYNLHGHWIVLHKLITPLLQQISNWKTILKLSRVNRVKLVCSYWWQSRFLLPRDPHLVKTAGKKLHDLSMVSTYMAINKRRILMKAFIILQFSHCPLVWMFHNRNRVNKIHERALRLVSDDSPYLSFDEMLTKDKSVSINQINL